MGVQRNGARTFLTVVHKACKLSHIPGFNGGLSLILGPSTAAALLILWTPLCAFVEEQVAQDNYFNKKDRRDDDDTGEDTELV